MTAKGGACGGESSVVINDRPAAIHGQDRGGGETDFTAVGRRFFKLLERLGLLRACFRVAVLSRLCKCLVFCVSIKSGVDFDKSADFYNFIDRNFRSNWGHIMATSVLMKNRNSNITKNGYVGFRWTYFFFGWWVPLIRGELGVAALHLLFSVFTFGIWQIIVSFMYNKQYMTRMLSEQGWILADSETKNALARMKLGIVQ
jgi:hypothetical protein